MDEGDADADEAEVVAVSAVPLPTMNGRKDQMLTNMGEKDAVVVVVAAATMVNTAEVDHLLVAIVSKGEEGDAGDMYRSMTTVMDDLLLIMALTHSHHLHPRTPRTQHHLSPLRHRTRNLPQPLLHHLYLGLHQ